MLLRNNYVSEVPKVRIHFTRVKSKEKNYKRSVDYKDEDEWSLSCVRSVVSSAANSVKLKVPIESREASFYPTEKMQKGYEMENRKKIIRKNKQVKIGKTGPWTTAVIDLFSLFCFCRTSFAFCVYVLYMCADVYMYAGISTHEGDSKYLWQNDKMYLIHRKLRPLASRICRNPWSSSLWTFGFFMSDIKKKNINL